MAVGTAIEWLKAALDSIQITSSIFIVRKYKHDPGHGFYVNIQPHRTRYGATFSRGIYLYGFVHIARLFGDIEIHNTLSTSALHMGDSMLRTQFVHIYYICSALALECHVTFSMLIWRAVLLAVCVSAIAVFS